MVDALLHSDKFSFDDKIMIVVCRQMMPRHDALWVVASHRIVSLNSPHQLAAFIAGKFAEPGKFDICKGG